VVQAGTATSVRTREEEQSFNIIEVDGDTVTVALMRWAGERFEPAVPTQFRKGTDGWKQQSQVAAEAASPA
jgi:N-acetylglutamate synthase/N-acetylornithine aminotransferase